eukprot:4284598-Pyramimonas_sp.AAC.1
MPRVQYKLCGDLTVPGVDGRSADRPLGDRGGGLRQLRRRRGQRLDYSRRARGRRSRGRGRDRTRG